MDKKFLNRIAILCISFILCLVVIKIFSNIKDVELSKELSKSIPEKISKWKNFEEQSIKPMVEQILGVDDYIWRQYKSNNGDLLDVYISYFSRIDASKTYHSPLNCMPGSGWSIYKIESIPIKLSNGKDVLVNSLTMKNGVKELQAIYWYQCRGRIIDTEYKERIYRTLDSIFKRETNGAFIRIISLTKGLSQRELKEFCANLIEILYSQLPS